MPHLDKVTIGILVSHLKIFLIPKYTSQQEGIEDDPESLGMDIPLP